ncbi:MAG: Ppx/GppA phosphatase family protein [Oligoflexus sp.]
MAQHTGGSELKVHDRLKESLRLQPQRRNDWKIGLSDISKLIDVLLAMKNLADPYKPMWRVVATQGLRSASNYEELIDQVYRHTQLKIEIIDGFEEARLSYLGMAHACEPSPDYHLFLDIGGGSTEFIIVENEEIRSLTSLKLGALRLSERFFDLSTPDDHQIKELRSYVEHRLAPLANELAQPTCKKGVGTAGTMKNVARVHHFLTHGTLTEDIHGYQLTQADLDQVCDHLISLRSPKKIKEAFNLESRRADILLAGALLLQSISKLFEINQWQTSSYGLREGLAYDTFNRLGLPSLRFTPVSRKASITRFAQRFHADIKFGEQMESLSRQAIEQLTQFVPVPDMFHLDDLKVLLSAGAYLYEIGKFINFSAYHQHSYYLITEGQLFGFSQEEHHIIALAILFSRKKPATEAKLRQWPYLRRHFETVNLLSFCLRLARCLNRSRRQRLKEFSLHQVEGKIIIQINPSNLDQIGPELHSLKKELKHLSRTIEKPIGIDIQIEESK